MSDCLNWINSSNTVKEAPISNYLYSKDYFKLGLKKFFFHRFEKRSAFTWIAGPLLEFKMISRELCHNQARAHNSMLGSRKKKNQVTRKIRLAAIRSLDSMSAQGFLWISQCPETNQNAWQKGFHDECLASKPAALRMVTRNPKINQMVRKRAAHLHILYKQARNSPSKERVARLARKHTINTTTSSHHLIHFPRCDFNPNFLLLQTPFQSHPLHLLLLIFNIHQSLH